MLANINAILYAQCCVCEHNQNMNPKILNNLCCWNPCWMMLLHSNQPSTLCRTTASVTRNTTAFRLPRAKHDGICWQNNLARLHTPYSRDWKIWKLTRRGGVGESFTSSYHFFPDLSELASGVVTGVVMLVFPPNVPLENCHGSMADKSDFFLLGRSFCCVCWGFSANFNSCRFFCEKPIWRNGAG